MNREVDAPRPLMRPSEGVARIYFVNDQGFPSTYAYVLEDGELLCFLQNEQHCFVDVAAGKHSFLLLGDGPAGVRGKLASGKTYHVRVFSRPDTWTRKLKCAAVGNSDQDEEMRDEKIEDTDWVTLRKRPARAWQNFEKRHIARHQAQLSKMKVGQLCIVGAEHAL